MAKDNETMKNMISQHAVTVVGKRGCCMVIVVMALLHGFGASPAKYDIDEDDEENVVDQLRQLLASTSVEGETKVGFEKLPMVFIGGKYFGGLDRVMASHIRGELIPALKQAGAIWL